MKRNWSNSRRRKYCQSARESCLIPNASGEKPYLIQD